MVNQSVLSAAQSEPHNRNMFGGRETGRDSAVGRGGLGAALVGAGRRCETQHPINTAKARMSQDRRIEPANR